MRATSLLLITLGAAAAGGAVGACALLPDTCDATETCAPPADASTSDVNAEGGAGLLPDGSAGDGGDGCTAGQTFCPGAGCVSTNTDVDHCGTCATACTASAGTSAACVGGQCVAACADGGESCGGSCFDTLTDPEHCGPSCAACPGPESGTGAAACAEGLCGVACTGGESACGGACFATASDPAHCGASCTACPVPSNGAATCASGACGVTCAAPTIACGAACVSKDDPAHCGNCTTECAGPASGNGSATCATGSCGISCSNGYFVCESDCHAKTAPPTDACVVTENVGVFVSTAGSDAPGNGTRAAPYATIGYAIANAKGLARVYVCAGTYASAVSVSASAPAVAVYGGFTCATAATWTYAPASAVVKIAPGSGVPLTVAQTTTALTFDNLELDAPNATAAGGSSIAAEVNGATGAVGFVGCTFSAGTGATGANGVTPSAALPVASAGSAADALSNAGGATAGPCVCPYGATSYGGQGGGGGPTPTDGSNGQPQLSVNQGAAGSSTANCANAAKGTDAPVVASDGPGATSVGSVVTGVWTPGPGATGASGSTGQGGGGGGGGYATVGLGNGGGGGGCGGCGGKGGGFGGGGGASIGAFVAGSPAVTFSTCNVKTAHGGDGGGGSVGQLGAIGGAKGGGPLTGNGCTGGIGGAGGKGGAGGGGAGGVSIGIAWQGTAPTVDSSTASHTSLGAVGAKGIGGDTPANDGIAGVSGAVVEVP